MDMACLAPGGVPLNARTEIILPESLEHLRREVALQGWNDFRRAATPCSRKLLTEFVVFLNQQPTPLFPGQRLLFPAGIEIDDGVGCCWLAEML